MDDAVLFLWARKTTSDVIPSYDFGVPFVDIHTPFSFFNYTYII